MVKEDVLTKLADYLQGRLDERQFEDWVVANLQAALDSKDDLVKSVVDEIDASLVEFQEGLLDTSEIFERFSRMQADLETTVLGSRSEVEVGAAAATEKIDMRDRFTTQAEVRLNWAFA